MTSSPAKEGSLHWGTFWRRAVVVLIAIFLSGPLLPPSQRTESIAQSPKRSETVTARGFGLTPLGTRVTFDPGPRARALLKPVLQAALLDGMDDRIIFRESPGIYVAVAVLDSAQRRYILYNPAHIDEMATRSDKYWLVVGILAHEVGHHARLHLEEKERFVELELEADRFAGRIMRRLGATLDQALTAFHQMHEHETDTHPGRKDRLDYVTRGWNAEHASLQKRTPPSRELPAAGAARRDSITPEQCRVLGSQRLLVSTATGPRCLQIKDTFRDCAECPEMILIPAGNFIMGSPVGEIAVEDFFHGTDRDGTAADSSHHTQTVLCWSLCRIIRRVGGLPH